jgi:hypothetical protein
MSHYVQLRYSNDGGNNYSMWQERETGETGAFLSELIWRRLGMTKHRIWEYRDTSNVAADILGAEIMAG